jgi:hypothetical protein
MGGQRHAPAAVLPGKTRYPLFRRLGGRQGRSGRVRKISPPPGFYRRTVQPAASRYTDWAIPLPTTYEAFSEMLKPKTSNVIKKYFAFWKTQVQIRTWNDCKSQFYTEIAVPFPLHDIPLSSLFLHLFHSIYFPPTHSLLVSLFLTSFVSLLVLLYHFIYPLLQKYTKIPFHYHTSSFTILSEYSIAFHYLYWYTRV